MTKYPVPVTEKQFQAQILQLASWLGYTSYHTYDSRKSAKGYPDLTLLKPGRIIFAELKTEAGKVRTEQQRWLALLKTCQGIEVYLWRPSQFDEIVTILKKKGGSDEPTA